MEGRPARPAKPEGTATSIGRTTDYVVSELRAIRQVLLRNEQPLVQLRGDVDIIKRIAWFFFVVALLNIFFGAYIWFQVSGA